MPAGVQDPATVISSAIVSAASAWTDKAARDIAGKNLKVCEVGACGVSNHDGAVVMVKTVDTTTKVGGEGDHDPDTGCGTSVACVKYGDPSISVPSQNGPGNHLRNLWLVIEEPAWECRNTDAIFPNGCEPQKHIRIYWTGKEGQHGKELRGLAPGSPTSEYYYIRSTMIHEFGHTFGLPDFGGHSSLKGLSAVMENPHTNKSITDEDIDQLRAIYAVHDSSDHN